MRLMLISGKCIVNESMLAGKLYERFMLISRNCIVNESMLTGKLNIIMEILLLGLYDAE